MERREEGEEELERRRTSSTILLWRIVRICHAWCMEVHRPKSIGHKFDGKAARLIWQISK